MTIGFAATIEVPGRGWGWVLAADSRTSLPDAQADIGMKTYSIGERVGAVGAGNALSCATAIDMTRETTAASRGQPRGFFNIVRAFAFFLDAVERERIWSDGCEVVLAGFLENGNPALAKIVSAPGRDTAVFVLAQTQPGVLLTLVGQSDAKEQIVSAMVRSLTERVETWMARAAGTIWYLCRHEGERTIGGGISLMACAPGEPAYWPFVEVDGKRYWRGMDITGDPSEGDVVELQYDESWHARVDENRTLPPQREGTGYVCVADCARNIVNASSLFELVHDPPELASAFDAVRPAAVVIAGRHGEMPTFGPRDA